MSEDRMSETGIRVEEVTSVEAPPKARVADVETAPEKLERAREILQAHGNYEWLTASGKFVILNNGIEFAATYLIMLLALAGLGSLTPKASALLIMGIAGGALLPLVYGALSQHLGAIAGYMVLLPCYAMILYYAVRGCQQKSSS